MIDGRVILSRKFRHPKLGYEIIGYICYESIEITKPPTFIVKFNANEILRLLEVPNRIENRKSYSLDFIRSLLHMSKCPSWELGKIVAWLASIEKKMLAEANEIDFKEKHIKELTRRIENLSIELDNLINTEIEVEND